MAQQWRTIPWNKAYEINTNGLVRRKIHGPKHKKGTYLLPYINNKDGNAYYSLPGLSSHHRFSRMTSPSTPKKLEFIMEEIWPEVKTRRYDLRWAQETRKWIFSNKKKSETYHHTKKIPQKKRKCRTCGRPSGVNYWCNVCRNLVAEFDCGYPAEGYSIGFL